jgi:hypothetical protein
MQHDPSQENPDQPQDPNAPTGPTPVGDSGQFTQRVRHQQVSARVPEQAAAGVFASGSLVLTGPHEFIIDFLQTVTRPHRVAARVVLPPTIVFNVVRALKQNVENYTARFGAPAELPKPPQGVKPPSVEEVYEQLKLDDATAAGACNTVMITHSASEFCFDFISAFYPRSTVAARVYMAAPQAPRLLETLNRSLEQYQQKLREAQQRQQRPPEDPPGGETRLA